MTQNGHNPTGNQQYFRLIMENEGCLTSGIRHLPINLVVGGPLARPPYHLQGWVREGMQSHPFKFTNRYYCNEIRPISCDIFPHVSEALQIPAPLSLPV